MLTKQDFKQLEAKFATKEDFKYLDKKIDLVFSELVKLIGDLRDEMRKGFAEIREEFKPIINRQQILLDDHDVRIHYLESSKNISS